MNNLSEKYKTIKVLMEYAVSEQDLADAVDLLDDYMYDNIALELFHEFYSYLPEGSYDWIREIRLIKRQQGFFLLAAVTSISCYVYLVSFEGAQLRCGITEIGLDTELLDFFKIIPEDGSENKYELSEEYPVYEPISSNEDICPVCHAIKGELHELGCPVEVCPWCWGQLISCNCRFEQLGLASIFEDKDLERLEELLEKHGRIPYLPEQRPSFPDI